MLERWIERTIFASRWLLAPIFLGLGVALVAYTLRFFKELWHLLVKAFSADEADLLLQILSLVDVVLVASLVTMVIISGYENFVSRLDVEDRHRISWLGKLDAGSLKVKVASSIVAISSIHLLRAYMNIEHGKSETGTMFWLVVGHLTFVVSALLMAVIDRISSHADIAKTSQ
jgi:uncharacterized protein (TIGR00645 family)